MKKIFAICGVIIIICLIFFRISKDLGRKEVEIENQIKEIEYKKNVIKTKTIQQKFIFQPIDNSDRVEWLSKINQERATEK